MVQCAIEGCTSRSDTQPAGFFHFHRIPTSTEIRQKWLQALNKSEVKTSARVCSLHFKQENYYVTEKGLHKLSFGSYPELKLPVKEDSDEDMKNVLPPKPFSYRIQSQQTSTIEIGRTTNVMGSTNIKHVENVKDDTTDCSSDEEMSNVQHLKQSTSYQSQSQQSNTKTITPKIGTTVNVLGSAKYYIQHGKEVNGDTTDSSEDEMMSNMQTQQLNINLPNQCQQNNSKEITTDNDKGSSTFKPGVQKHKVTTQLERKLLKEVKRLKERGEKRMQAIGCLLEQNRRLLDRNSFLEQELNNSIKRGTNRE